MDSRHLPLLQKMISYYSGDPRRIQHFLKVYEFSSLLGQMEKLSDNEQFILETAALVHDIGIKKSEEKYNSSAGKYQEIEGPAICEEFLTELSYDADTIGRISYLVAHHHTYQNIEGKEYQLLVEADFLVNAWEDTLSIAAISAFQEKVFRSASGKHLLQTIYSL